ncbi:hypothetical protein NIES4074_04280 [Cylindrospermum sp. NIES-4074]|nr:hypothetical protein NIES4074_04280 [Cylindrospermum sp. NIES-4074]
MGAINEKAVAWSEKAQLESVNISRGDGIARREGENAGNQQERDDRAYSKKSSLFSPGAAITGGILDHLIKEYYDQVASKEDEIQRISDEIKKLKTKIEEFKVLREEFHKQPEETL